jgi:hypothetical protein
MMQLICRVAVILALRGSTRTSAIKEESDHNFRLSFDHKGFSGKKRRRSLAEVIRGLDAKAVP